MNRAKKRKIKCEAEEKERLVIEKKRRRSNMLKLPCSRCCNKKPLWFRNRDDFKSADDYVNGFCKSCLIVLSNDFEEWKNYVA